MRRYIALLLCTLPLYSCLGNTPRITMATHHRFAPACYIVAPGVNSDPDGAEFEFWADHYDALDYIPATHAYGIWAAIVQGRPYILGYSLQEDSDIYNDPACLTD